MPKNLVDSSALTAFLQRLGQCYRQPGRVYLVGGSSLILVAAKVSTFDIDLEFEVEQHSEFIRCLRELGRSLNLAIPILRLFKENLTTSKPNSQTIKPTCY